MAITATQSQSNVQLNQSFGSHIDTASTPALKTITVGFNPRYVKYVDATNRIQWEWYSGMANGTTVKTVAAGTVTLDTGNAAISVDSAVVTSTYADTGKVSPVSLKGDWIITIAAAAITQNAQGYFEILE